MPELPTGTVTFLFTDIESSTRLLQRLGDAYRDLLATHDQILRDAIAAGGGVVVQTEGDSFFAAFPTAARAVRATIQAQRVLSSLPWPDGNVVRVRMGIHTGEGSWAARTTLGSTSIVPLGSPQPAMADRSSSPTRPVGSSSTPFHAGSTCGISVATA